MFLLSHKISVGYGFLLLWIIMLQSDLPISRACIEDERISLLDFKAGLNLSSGRLSSWRGFNCCQWEGVGCDYHTSHVIRLDLSYRPYAYTQELSGEIRPSLFNLEHLQQLDLSWNDFKGISIPPQLSKLHRLTFLSLKQAGFGGEVPLELGNMSRLRHLDISAQYYSHMLNSSKFDVWARNLRSLEFLRMDGVNLTMASEKWGKALSGLASLREIHLFDCGLSGNIPDLSNLSSLSHLHIGYNSFPFELPPWFENVSSLVSLDLKGCRLNGSIPSNFIPRSKLNNLVLSSNYDLKGNLSFILNYSSSLVVLSLAGCNLGGEIPASIADFSKLETMDLSYNSFEGGIPSSFGSLSSLATLDLSDNQLTGQIPTSLCQLLVLSKLDLSHNQLSGTIPESISMLASIELLSLNYNHLTGKILPSLCELLVLSELHLGHNQLSGTIPDSILKLASLEVLTLPSNRLRGNISLPMFDNLTRLQGLDLSENQFTIAISTSWVPQFGHLVYLGLRSCNIEGDFPPLLSQQYELEYLDLSSNYIV
ncbi:hypothetical protein SUGI_0866370 [Cryptomeria japonica]|nr:hypothetical protein SUGI_0866370 [Cryptomeria japonica]